MADRVNEAEGIDQIASSMYDSSDLNFLQNVVENLLEELFDTGEYLFDPRNSESLKLQLSAAVFKCAEGGERDYENLRRRVISTFSGDRQPSASRHSGPMRPPDRPIG